MPLTDNGERGAHSATPVTLHSCHSMTELYRVRRFLGACARADERRACACCARRYLRDPSRSHLHLSCAVGGASVSVREVGAMGSYRIPPLRLTGAPTPTPDRGRARLGPRAAAPGAGVRFDGYRPGREIMYTYTEHISH